MKKLFLFAALLMTGFAFYSCDDVVDNPVQDATAEWSYEVSVKFADFKFWYDPTDETSQIMDGVTGEPYLYKAPQTIYVYNMENELLGSLTTSEEIDDLSKSYKFSGKLNGAIGESLMISTLSTADYAKQDGTLKSIVDNSLILENAVVPVRHYSEAANKVTTANAELQCNLAIARAWMGSLNAGDKLTFTDDVRTFEWTVNEDFDPTINSEIYIAVPTNGDPEMAYTATTESENGYIRGFTIGDEVNTLNPGEVKTFGMPGIPPIQFEDLGVDLTKWDAYQREEYDITGTTWLTQPINADKTFIVTQSGAEAVNACIRFNGNLNDDVKLILNNVKLAEDCYFGIYNGAKFDLNMIGENKLHTVTLNSPFTWKGAETCEFDQLNIGGNAYMSGTDLVVNYAAEYTINEDMTLKHLSVANGGKLTIAEGKKVTVINDEGIAVSVYHATFNIGKGATLQAESKAKDAAVINIESADFNVGENATVTAQGGKEGRGLSISHNNYSEYQKANVNIGKNATVNLIGGPEGVLGYGLYIYNEQNSTTTITLDEGAKVNATGIDRYGIYCHAVQWSSYTNTVTFNIAKNAKITAEDVLSGGGLYAEVQQATLNFDGEGTLEAKSKDGTGMQLNLYYLGKLNFKCGNISAIAGGDKPAITCNNFFTIAPEIKSFKAQKGATATQYISRGDSEVDIANLVTDKTQFIDDTADGVRTITPKPAAE